MKKVKLEFEETKKLNLIPLMDVVFIFIFFTISASDLNDFKEIASSISKMALIEGDEGIPENNLNLNVVVSYENILVRQGSDQEIISEITGFGDDQINELNTFMKELKNTYPKEDKVTVIPSEKFKYKDIIIVLDAIKMDISDNNRSLFDNVALGDK